MREIIFVLMLAFPSLCTGQYADTIINKKHYNTIWYYGSELLTKKPTGICKLFAYGNYCEGLKTGHWKYFDKNGQPFAKGKYVDGKKKGTWKYYRGKTVVKTKWYGTDRISEKIEFRKYGIIMVDIIEEKDGEAETTYENGRPLTEHRGCVRFL